MSQLLPRKPPVEHSDSGPKVVGLTNQKAADVFAALSADVAKSILEMLYEQPTTQSKLADRLNTSIQNVDYHLGNLVEAGLVEVVDQWYSEKGTEMDVYVPSAEPLVVVAGNHDHLEEARHTIVDQTRDAATPGD